MIPSTRTPADDQEAEEVAALVERTFTEAFDAYNTAQEAGSGVATVTLGTLYRLAYLAGKAVGLEIGDVSEARSHLN